ncbi:MAG: thiolase domain-containing protein [Actinobacteria bacterium]|nr:thiolase domain-containing protein [Actinomycetota bacterium]
MIDVAVVSFAQWSAREEPARNEVEILIPVVAEAIERSGIGRKEIGFTVSGSCDYLAGAPFAFVTGLDAVGAWPPIRESHVEMDGAWALYEAWVRLQHGDIDSALVYSFGKSSLGDLPIVLSQQLDPYYQAPLWLDSISAAALQARAWLNAGHDEGEMAEVAARSRRAAKDNPNAVVSGDQSAEALLREPFLVTPLRRHDCPPISDGAVAVVLAAGDRAREVCERPAWIRGIDHRIEAHGLGVRELATSASARLAGERAGVDGVDVAELHAPFSHQEPILRDALGLSNGVDVNPSGGALAANVVMGAGLTRIGEAASRIMDGRAARAVAHATSGPCLQHNLVCVLAGDAT